MGTKHLAAVAADYSLCADTGCAATEATNTHRSPSDHTSTGCHDTSETSGG